MNVNLESEEAYSRAATGGSGTSVPAGWRASSWPRTSGWAARWRSSGCTPTARRTTARRFEREARLGASLNHPNLVAVYDVETDGESVLIVMEYVEGKTLRGRAGATGRWSRDRRSRWSPTSARRWTTCTTRASCTATSSPATSSSAATAWPSWPTSASRRRPRRTSITGSGIGAGHRRVHGARAGRAAAGPGPAADIYALAAVAYEALSASSARASGTTPVEIAHRVANEPGARHPRRAGPRPRRRRGRGARARHGAAARRTGPASAGRAGRELERRACRGRGPTATVALPVSPRRAAPPAAAPDAAPPVAPPPGRSPRVAARRSRRRVAARGRLAALALAVVAVAVLARAGDSPSGDRGRLARATRRRPQTEPAQAEAQPAPRRSPPSPSRPRAEQPADSRRPAPIPPRALAGRRGLRADPAGRLRGGGPDRPAGGGVVPRGRHRAEPRLRAVQPGHGAAPVGPPGGGDPAAWRSACPSRTTSARRVEKELDDGASEGRG